jgi:hypothetical protein
MRRADSGPVSDEHVAMGGVDGQFRPGRNRLPSYFCASPQPAFVTGFRTEAADPGKGDIPLFRIPLDTGRHEEGEKEECLLFPFRREDQATRLILHASAAAAESGAA